MFKTSIKLVFAYLMIIQVALANKSDLFLLKTYDDSKDFIGWVMSETLDGFRGFWNGQELITRGGMKLMPPKWFIKNYPPFSIDAKDQLADFLKEVTADKG